MSELDDALILADRILDRPSADPDDDLGVLARQLVRVTEAKNVYKAYAAALKALYELRTKQYHARCGGTVRDTKLEGELMEARERVLQIEDKWNLK